MYGINIKSNGVARMYVMTSVTHKLEVRINLLTFMQIVNNFALEPSSKFYSFHNLFMNRIVYAMLLLFIPYKFLVRMMLKFRIYGIF